MNNRIIMKRCIDRMILLHSCIAYHITAPIASFNLSLGENVTIQSLGYPVYLPITRPLMKTWTFSAVGGTRLRLDIIHLQMESVDHFTLGTGFDIHNASTILYEVLYV